MNSDKRERKKAKYNKDQNISSGKTEGLLSKGNNPSQKDGFRYDYDDASDLN